MNLSLAGIHCQRCCESKDLKKGDYHCWKLSEALNSFLGYQYQEYECDFIDDSTMGTALLFIKRLQNVCFNCKREKPLAQRIIKEEYVEPFNKAVKEAIAREKAIIKKEGKSKKKKSRVLKLSDYCKRE